MLFYENLNEYTREERAKLDLLTNANLPEVGFIEEVLLPDDNKNRESSLAQYSVTQQAKLLEIDYQGIIGDRHRHLYRLTTGRDKAIYPKETQVRGFRHVLAVSLYDCNVLSEKMGVAITPQLLGANMVISRIDKKDFSLSQLPHGSYLAIAPEDSIVMPRPPLAVLVHYVKQMGCGTTGFAIAERYHDKKLTKAFVQSAADYRGILCGVDYPVAQPAIIKPKQKVFFKYPKSLTT